MVRYQGGEVLAEVVRSGFVESRHHGSVVAVDAAGTVVAAAGDVTNPVFPRSANKPLQAVGMLRAGLSASRIELGLVAASHRGEDFHVAVVRRLLAAAGVDESALACPESLPADDDAQEQVLRSGLGKTRIRMNCSGKHAGMLRTCTSAGWPVQGYTDAGHPLQKSLRSTVEELSGEAVTAVGVDGCGAPLFALSLRGLATAFSHLMRAEDGPEREVVDAMCSYPQMVSGTTGEDTALMRAVPELIAKAGAEGVQAVAVRGVGAVAVKIDDGQNRAARPVAVAGLRRLGVTVPVPASWEAPAVAGGDEQVGTVRVTW